jgi:hypothetical protein
MAQMLRRGGVGPPLAPVHGARSTYTYMYVTGRVKNTAPDVDLRGRDRIGFTTV